MNENKGNFPDWSLAFSLLSFVALIVTQLINIYIFGDINPQGEVLGKTLLAILTGIAAFIVLVLIYRSLLTNTWRNWLRLRRVKSKINEFIQTYDGRTVPNQADIQKILLNHYCLKARSLKIRVSDIKYLDQVNEDGNRLIELTVNKGSDNKIITGMTFAAYWRRNANAFVLTDLQYYSNYKPEEENHPVGLIGSTVTRLLFFLPKGVNIPDGQLKKNQFEVRLVEPENDEPINYLLGELFFEVDRNWGLDDIRHVLSLLRR